MPRAPSLRDVFAQSDEAAVYVFAKELLDQQRISEASFDRAVRVPGLPGVVELVGILGYYSFVAVTLVGFEIDLPAGAVQPFRSLKPRGPAA